MNTILDTPLFPPTEMVISGSCVNKELIQCLKASHCDPPFQGTTRNSWGFIVAWFDVKVLGFYDEATWASNRLKRIAINDDGT